MVRDPRGGHNRKQVNESFFKTWSPKMAYVLGLICADGAVEDVRKSSRTCYLQITSIHKKYLEDIKQCLGSNHVLAVIKPRLVSIKGGKFYTSLETYRIRIGNKAIVQDLINLGVTPRKSLRLQLPNVPAEYLSFFIRGYFDGDGCVNVSRIPRRKKLKISVIYTSGCCSFLHRLSEAIENILPINHQKIRFNHGAYRLAYSCTKAIRLLNFMYANLSLAPYLGYKFDKFQKYLSNPFLPVT